MVQRCTAKHLFKKSNKLQYKSKCSQLTDLPDPVLFAIYSDFLPEFLSLNAIIFNETLYNVAFHRDLRQRTTVLDLSPNYSTKFNAFYLENSPNVKYLRLKNMIVDSTILEVIYTLDSLRYLEIDNCSFDFIEFSKMEPILRKLEGLSLKCPLFFERMSDACAKNESNDCKNWMDCLTNLKHLSIDCLKGIPSFPSSLFTAEYETIELRMPNEDYADVSYAILSAPNLKRVALTATDLTREINLSESFFLKSMKNLRSLGIEWKSSPPDMSHKLLPCIKQLKHLQHLQLAACYGLESQLSELFDSLNQLKIVELRLCRMYPAALKKIALSCFKLHTLRISEVGPVTSLDLEEFIKKCRNLTTLQLDFKWLAKFHTRLFSLMQEKLNTLIVNDVNNAEDLKFIKLKFPSTSQQNMFVYFSQKT